MTTARALTRAQLRELERELRSERARLERSMMAHAGADGGVPFGIAPRDPQNAEGGLDVALETRTLNRALVRHEALVDAIRRLETGTYGTCVRCQSDIPYGRLIVMPEATHCVACGPRA